MSITMSDFARMCANCVYWTGRGSDDGPARHGRCHARLLEQPDPRLAMMTQADFVCTQWCGAQPAGAAAE